ncbi:hypothetical protein Q8F55_000787 [Vanrija albida]|uniref:Histidine kinase n=1 Tax=Vanrija albida TaxID=181172 RepID=A0ABR3QEB5_9TREE
MTGGNVPPQPKPSSRTITDWSLDASLKTTSYSGGSADGVEGGIDSLGLESSLIDMSRLPKEYLEAYPYPAFVLVNDVPPHPWANSHGIEPTSVIDLPFTQTQNTSSISLPSFTPVWANEPWKLAADGLPLLSCLSIDSARLLGEWLSGAQDLRVRSISEAANNVNIPGAESPQEVPDTSPGSLSDVTTVPSLTSSSTQETTHSSTPTDTPPAPSTLTLEFNFPSGPRVYEIIKSTMPVYYNNRKDASQIGTHSFAIITTIPRPAAQPQPQRLLSQVTPQQAGIPTVTMVELSDEAKTPSIPKGPDLARSMFTGKVDEPRWSPESNTPHAMESPSLTSGPVHFYRDGRVRNIVSAPSLRSESDDDMSKNVHALLDRVDWTQTSLGAKEDWSQSLKTSVSMVLNYPLKACLWWGKDFTLIYNQMYAEQVPDHPNVFGKSGPQAWAEMWTVLGPLTELVLGGTPIYREDDFFLWRKVDGEPMYEAYRSHVWLPILQPEGQVGGLFHSMVDTTDKVLSERRMAAIREMGERTLVARTVEEFSQGVLEGIESSYKDTPFALLYHVEPPNTPQPRKTFAHIKLSDDQFMSTEVQLRYAGGVGVPDGHPSAPETTTVTIPPRSVDVSRSIKSAFTDPDASQRHSSASIGGVNPFGNAEALTDPDEILRSASASKASGHPWPFVEAIQTRQPVLVEDCSSIIAGYPVRVWDELPTKALVIPIIHDSEEGLPNAILVVGLNIRRPYEADYKSFIIASGLTAVRSYQAEIRRIEELAALDRAKSMLFSNVSHELRTPLTLIAGPIEDLVNEMPDGPQREALIMARRNVRRMTRLVSMLMDASKLEAGRLKGSFRLVNLGIVTRDIVSLFRTAMDRTKLEFIVDCDLNPREVYVDAEKWEKILFNLVGNAMKYTMDGYVKVILRYTGEEAIVEVVDTGVGIPISDLSSIGERFFRAESVAHLHEGTGIGLSLTKKLIQLHHGTLDIESNTAEQSGDGSHGSVFRVRLPLGRSHLPADAIEDDVTDIVSSSRSYTPAAREEWHSWSEGSMSEWFDADEPSTNVMSGLGPSSRGIDPNTLYFKKEDVIMLVDDSADTRRYVRSILEPFCTIVEARDGQEALDTYDDKPPDLIIADVMMPRLDGFGLLEALRKGTKEQQMVPFILLTAIDDGQFEGLLAGADDYLSTPFNARELVARVHMQLQLGKKRNTLETLFDERTAELRTLTELSPVGIFRCTPDGYVSYANHAWHDLTGYPIGQEITNWGDYILEDHQARIRHLWETYVPSTAPSVWAEWQWKNGRWGATQVLRLDEVVPGSPPGFIGCSIDTTERKLNEQMHLLRVKEAEQRREEAEAAKHQQELLIDITSHEIRNPISSLMQCSSLVKTNLTALQDELKRSSEGNSVFKPTPQLLATIDDDLEALESIYQCALTQERISNDVLSLGKIQLDMLQMFDVETTVVKEAQKAVSVFQNEARMKRIDLSMELGEAFEKMGIDVVLTDPVRLGQVVTNLLSNAIRFTATSKVRKIELKVDVGLEPPTDETCVKPEPSGPLPSSLEPDTPVYLFVSVSDTGPGLTEDELDMLFRRFSQASAKTHTVFGGSGLGLFVCRKITERMGGRIEGASRYGQGSTFRFFIKAKACPTPNGQGHPGTPLADATAFNWDAKKPHILVVEDNLINQTVLRRQLKHVGLTVDCVSNGVEALDKIRSVMSVVEGTGERQNTTERGYDCVLMDLEMPIMDGYTAAHMLRADEAAGKLAPTSIIALTGNARQALINEAMADFDGVVVKPYRLDQLLGKIEELTKADLNRAKGAMYP